MKSIDSRVRPADGPDGASLPHLWNGVMIVVRQQSFSENKMRQSSESMTQFLELRNILAIIVILF